MEKSALKPYIVVITLLVLTSVALAYTVDVNVSDQAGIDVFLPDNVADWTGMELRYCVSASCQKTYGANELEDINTCPTCGEPLSGLSFAEKTLLPGDTTLLRKRYTSSAGDTIFAAIVLSGKERASIHRPQVCLVGQGRIITDTTKLSVPIEDRHPLDVMVLDLHRSWKTSDGTSKQSTSYYSYWFVGKGRETPSHIQRMIWMASDRIFHNISHRWAYISISGHREEGSDSYREDIETFIAALYPQMLKKEDA